MNCLLSGCSAALFAMVTVPCAPPRLVHDAAESAPSASAGYGNIPMSFIANHGQTDAQVRFLARGQGYSLFLTRAEAVLMLRAAASRPAAAAGIVRLRLVGGNQAPQIAGIGPLEGTSNFFMGSVPAQWHRDVPTYAGVKYTDVYPGIDQVFYGRQRQLEFDFVVAPGADPEPIAMAFDGVQALSLDADGNLVLATADGNLIQQKPVIYQDIGGRRRLVEGRYRLAADDRVGFELSAYDTRYALVIDPVLSYATYLGGNSNDVGHAIAVDQAGNAFITGETLSTNFPGVSGSFQPVKAASYDAFVTKINAAGSAVIYSTYLGGSGGDYSYAIAVDGAGNAFVTGETDSPTVPGPGNVPFPVVGAVQPEHRGGGDAFITKINAAGNGLVYSTYLGGSGVERGYGIALDTTASAYVTGHTNSFNILDHPTNFPIVGGVQGNNASFSYDAFVTKLNASGNAVVYSTFLGGDDSEYSNSGGAIAVDGAGNAYVAGSTRSVNFPGAKTLQANHNGDIDGFVVKFNAAGGLVYSTYLGGSGREEVNGLAIDSGGDAFVAGYTDSTNFPTSSPLQAAKSGSGNDAFVARLNATGSGLVYSTYLGGSDGELAYHVAVDQASNAYIAGWTQSANFPILQPFQTATFGSGDAFVTALTAAGTLVYSSRMGGSNGGEHAHGIAVDSTGAVYVTGQTNSTNFPTANPLQATLGTPGTDAFVAKINAPAPTVLGAATGLIATAIIGNTVTLAWTAPGNSIAPTGYVLEGGVLPGETLASIATNTVTPSFTFTAPTGAFYVRMHAVAGGLTSAASNEIRIFVNVPAPPSSPVNLLGLVEDRTLSLAWTNTAGGGTPEGMFIDVTGSLAATISIAAGETFSFPNVPDGTYTLSLRAFNSAGVSGSSNSLTLTFPTACNGVPATPAGLVVTKTGNLVSAFWNLPPSGPAPKSYVVNVSGGFTGSLGVLTRSISGAVAPGSYTLSVSATNSCGTSLPSAPQTITIP